MAPALAHPSGVTFIDEQKPVDTEAAVYYGGKEQFSRGRTYSAVSLFKDRPGIELTLIVDAPDASLSRTDTIRSASPRFRTRCITAHGACPTTRRASLCRVVS